MSSAPCSVVVAIACLGLGAGCSGGGSGGAPAPTAAEELRTELTDRDVHPLPDPPAVSDELFELGRLLFFDKILSGSQDVACSTCHAPSFASADARTLSNGVGGIGLGPTRGGGVIVPRNGTPLFNVHLEHRLFWDGRVERVGTEIRTPAGAELTPELEAVFAPELALLAAQAMIPVVTRAEMRGAPGSSDVADLADDDFTGVWNALLERLLAVPQYVQLLELAYPGTAIQDFTFAHAANAIAGFEARAFARVDSPLQRFLLGDDAALTPEEIGGAFEFFGRADCAQCHSGTLFSDVEFHDIGLPQLGPGKGNGPSGREDFGRENVTGDAGDRYRFRTPMLYDVALTAPYGHAGQFASLREFVRHYTGIPGSIATYDINANVSDPELVLTLVPNGDAVLAALDPLLESPFNPFDIDAIVAFLGALTADGAYALEELIPASVPSGLPVD